MGMYGDQAAKDSKYLDVPNGKITKAEWSGKGRLIPNKFDPDNIKMSAELIFSTEFGEKKFTISSAKQYKKFDDYKAGDIILLDKTEKDAKGNYPLKVSREDEIAENPDSDLPF